MKEKEKCSVCGKELNPEELTEFEGALFCNHCLNETTALCACCHTRIRLTESYGDEATVLCKHCYYEYYTRCERCNCLIASSDANYFSGCDLPYCDDCFDEMEDNSSIHDYGYKPEKIEEYIYCM